MHASVEEMQVDFGIPEGADFFERTTWPPPEKDDYGDEQGAEDMVRTPTSKSISASKRVS